MDSIKVQVILFWVAVTFYVVATVLTLISSIFDKPRLLRYLPWLGIGGLIPQTAGLILRWIQTGHFPYWGHYEVFNVYAWGAILLYFIARLLKPEMKVVSALLFPVAFFMTGTALTGSKEVTEIPASFLTYWLAVHVAFAKMAYGAGLISAFFGGIYLLKTKRMKENRPSEGFLKWAPDPEKADYYVYKFAVFAFITMTIMIGAGAIWAFKAWGRYWGWDPVETWALVSWFVYGIFLHLRVTYGWRGERSAWFSIAAVLVIIFSYFGLPLLYDTVHEHLNI